LRQQQAETARRIDAVEAVLDAAGYLATEQSAGPQAAATTNSVPGATLPAPAAGLPAELTIAGDLRLRYEANWSHGSPNRDRGVLRARLGARYQATPWLAVGARLVTGDSDDPQSADATLTGFADDLSVALDLAWAELRLGAVMLAGGKIVNPFVNRTEMLWDGDVNPQGVSARWAYKAGAITLGANALWFLIDEAPAGPDSRMWGVQGTIEARVANDVVVSGAAAWHDYSLSALGGGDAGDFRSNLRDPDGRYLSDFRLLNLNATATWAGLGAHWPVALAGDYVRNLGAATADNSGWWLESRLGRIGHKGDWRFTWSYAEVETDAVFAAFSHDNTLLATNYRQQVLSVDYSFSKPLMLTATYSRVKPLNPAHAGPFDPVQWINRLRLNMTLGW